MPGPGDCPRAAPAPAIIQPQQIGSTLLQPEDRPCQPCRGAVSHKESLRGRVYGADHDHPGPRPDRDYAELVGGPLDGLLLDTTGWTADEIQTHVVLTTELGQIGAGGQALYDPRPGERNRWD